MSFFFLTIVTSDTDWNNSLRFDSYRIIAGETTRTKLQGEIDLQRSMFLEGEEDFEII